MSKFALAYSGIVVTLSPKRLATSMAMYTEANRNSGMLR